MLYRIHWTVIVFCNMTVSTYCTISKDLKGGNKKPVVLTYSKPSNWQQNIIWPHPIQTFFSILQYKVTWSDNLLWMNISRFFFSPVLPSALFNNCSFSFSSSSCSSVWFPSSSSGQASSKCSWIPARVVASSLLHGRSPLTTSCWSYKTEIYWKKWTIKSERSYYKNTDHKM